jgi:pimeloyl-ACP methyl ester carboxylesterase
MRKPNSLLYLSEFGRAMLELGTMPLARPWMARSKTARPHAVLVVPGFTTNGRSTMVLRKTLQSLGYDARTWNQGINFGVRQELFDGVTDELDRLHKECGGKVSLIGQSLGGIYARQLAKVRADKVSRVITLGSPVNDPEGHASHVSHLYKSLNPEQLVEDRDTWPFNEWLIDEPPSVPTSVIYSKYDGICHWQSCVQHGDHDRVENIEIVGSHIGMAINPLVQYVIAERLAGSVEDWQPFKAPPFSTFLRTSAQKG